MKTKIIIFSLLIILSTALCQAKLINLTTATLIIPTLYLGSKMYQSEGNFRKMERLIRQDKDNACQYLIHALDKDNQFTICKNIIHLLEQAQSSKEQQIADKIADKVEACKDTAIDLQQKVQDTIADGFKAATDKSNEIYQAGKEEIHRLTKPKK